MGRLAGLLAGGWASGQGLGRAARRPGPRGRLGRAAPCGAPARRLSCQMGRPTDLLTHFSLKAQCSVTDQGADRGRSCSETEKQGPRQPHARRLPTRRGSSSGVRSSSPSLCLMGVRSSPSGGSGCLALVGLPVLGGAWVLFGHPVFVFMGLWVLGVPSGVRYALSGGLRALPLVGVRYAGSLLFLFVGPVSAFRWLGLPLASGSGLPLPGVPSCLRLLAVKAAPCSSSRRLPVSAIRRASVLGFLFGGPVCGLPSHLGPLPGFRLLAVQGARVRSFPLGVRFAPSCPWVRWFLFWASGLCSSWGSSSAVPASGSGLRVQAAPWALPLRGSGIGSPSSLHDWVLFWASGVRLPGCAFGGPAAGSPGASAVPLAWVRSSSPCSRLGPGFGLQVALGALLPLWGSGRLQSKPS